MNYFHITKLNYRQGDRPAPKNKKLFSPENDYKKVEWIDYVSGRLSSESMY